MRKRLTTVDQIIDAFGLEWLARWAGYESVSGVCNWRTRGIPPGLHVRLIAEATRRGFVIEPTVFGLADSDARGLRKLFAEAGAER